MSAIAPVQPIREPDLAELLADTAYIEHLSDLHARCVLARNGLRLIEQRNQRSLQLAKEEYQRAAAALAEAVLARKAVLPARAGDEGGVSK